MTTFGILPVEVTTGAFWKKLPDTIIYSATIPLTYESTLLQDDPQEIFTPLYDHLCKGGNTHVCKMSAELEDLGKLFDKEVKLFRHSVNPHYWGIFIPDAFEEGMTINQKDSSTRNKRALDFIGDFFSFCCGVATEHKLDSLQFEEHELKTLLFRIDSGLRKNLREIANTSQNFYYYQKQIADNFLETRQKIKQISDFDNNLRNTIDKTIEATDFKIQRSMYHLYTTMVRLINFERSVNHMEIINACKDHKIPPAVIHPLVLRQDLNRLSKELNKNNYDLAIPIKDISRYYKLSICDCTTTKNKIFIHVRIPIIKSGQTWTLYQLITTPFAWKNDTCLLMHNTLYLAVAHETKSIQNRNKNPILKTITGSSLHHCRPYHDKLCFIPRFSSDETYGHQCAYKMYLGTTVEDLGRHCSFQCHSSTAMVISEVRDDTYVLTHPKRDTVIRCPDGDTKLDDSVYGHPGSLKIDLPCSCSLLINKEEVISPRFPCGIRSADDFSIKHILPAVWSNLKTFIVHNTHTEPIFNNVSECLNNDWTSTIPHLNVSTSSVFSKIENNIEDLLHKDYDELYAPRSDCIYLAWNILLSLSIFYLLFKRNVFGTTLIQPVAAQSVNTEDNTGVLLFSAIILFFIAYLILQIYLLYACIKGCRKNGNSRPREEGMGLSTIETECKDNGNTSLRKEGMGLSTIETSDTLDSEELSREVAGKSTNKEVIPVSNSIKLTVFRTGTDRNNS